MRTRNLIEKALDLVLRGRIAKDTKTNNEILDSLWELLVNLEYELKQKQTPSLN